MSSTHSESRLAACPRYLVIRNVLASLSINTSRSLKIFGFVGRTGRGRQLSIPGVREITDGASAACRGRHRRPAEPSLVWGRSDLKAHALLLAEADLSE